MAACSFAGCGRPARARGFCTGHLAQQARGAALAPLASRAEVPRVAFPVRVSPRVAAAASADPEGARATLERWAHRRTTT